MKLPEPVTATGMHINALIYGPQGAGKTTFAASAQDHPDMAPVLFIDFEGGLLSVSSRGDIQSVRIESIKELEEVFWALKRGDEPFNQFKTVVIDSATEMASLSLQEAIQRGLKSGTHKSPPDKAQVEEYGEMLNQMSRILRWFRNLPMHVLITGLIKGVTNAEGNVIEYRPMMTNSLGDSIMGFVDFVWCMQPTEDGRAILTRNQGVYRAKTRGLKFGEAIGPIVNNPTLPELWEVLQQTEGSAVTEEETVNV